MSKVISCGIIITDGKKVLVGHATECGFQHDIPKGRHEYGEKFIETAIRELKEETGLDVKECQLTNLGRFEYTQTKDLELFLWPLESLPDIKSLNCTSYFTNVKGKTVPEFDGYKLVSFSDLKKYLRKPMYKVFQKIFQLS
jgi:8-oxo-dGTP pyrophosphatase MutT (NUDIX family)